MLSNLLTALGALLVGLAVAHVSPWWAVVYAGVVFLLVGAALGRADAPEADG